MERVRKGSRGWRGLEREAEGGGGIEGGIGVERVRKGSRGGGDRGGDG